ncbi:MucR family transcriptional regulator [Methylobacterium hispanicum]|nr:MucR family transcriptional regulator [Methylobacterium hispanicum]
MNESDHSYLGGFTRESACAVDTARLSGDGQVAIRPIHRRNFKAMTPNLDLHRTRVALVSTVVGAYVSNNSVPAAELPALIGSVHAALAALETGHVEGGVVEDVSKPTAAQIRKSVSTGGIVSFLDGRSYKTMKRHLTTHGLTPEGYRERFGLPGDYPMVCRDYATQRSELAKKFGLGRPGSMKAQGEGAPAAKATSRKAQSGNASKAA